MHLRLILIGFLLCTILSGCSADLTNKDDDTFESFEPVPSQHILKLLCGSGTNCIQTICPEVDKCPIIIALSHPVVFDFVETYSKCDGCSTSDFSPDNGIGKCIEYDLLDKSLNKEIIFKVSENCNFRYANPEQVQISVFVDIREWRINQINPGIEYIQDPNFCAAESDCRCLSGSGVPLFGASNVFYAPLNWSGYYEGKECGCLEGNCVVRDGGS